MKNCFKFHNEQLNMITANMYHSPQSAVQLFNTRLKSHMHYIYKNRGFNSYLRLLVYSKIHHLFVNNSFPTVNCFVFCVNHSDSLCTSVILAPHPHFHHHHHHHLDHQVCILVLSESTSLILENTLDSSE